MTYRSAEGRGKVAEHLKGPLAQCRWTLLYINANCLSNDRRRRRAGRSGG
jgi:hypothetical protein